MSLPIYCNNCSFMSESYADVKHHFKNNPDHMIAANPPQRKEGEIFDKAVRTGLQKTGAFIQKHLSTTLGLMAFIQLIASPTYSAYQLYAMLELLTITYARLSKA